MTTNDLNHNNDDGTNIGTFSGLGVVAVAVVSAERKKTDNCLDDRTR